MRPKPRYQPGDKIGGRYLVHQALMGGMGEVYLCLDLETIQPYALKTFQQRYLTKPKLRTAFENEVAIWVALEKHPNIVRCHFMEIIDNQPFMFLEWIASDESRGTDLRSWLRRGPLDLRLALDFTIDICRGLIHANEKQPGIVHRDLKPENILVAQGRLAKITDFGLARIVQEAGLEITADTESETEGRQSLLGQGGIVGTPIYMAPEQWRREELDARTDIYAIGCVLYEMLTGHWPFRATSLDGLRRRHLEAHIPRLADRQSVPGSLDTLLTCCMAKQREDRFASVENLLQRLTLVYRQELDEMPRRITVSQGFTAREYCERGVTYERLGLYDQALADYDQSIELDSTAATTHFDRGVTNQHLGRYDKALSDYDEAIKRRPDYQKAYANRGVVHFELERYDEALRDFAWAIRLDPTDALVYYSRANLYRRVERHEEALADYCRAIELDATDAESYYGRGLTYAKLQRHDESLADLARALELDPNLVFKLDPTDAWLYCIRGLMYALAHRYDEAVADYDQAIQLDPDFALAYASRGVAYRKLHQYNEALADYDRAIQLDPTSAEVHYNRGLAHYHLQRYDEALADFSRAIQLDPTHAKAYSDRGLTYKRLKQYDEALADYNQAIQLDTTHALAYSNRGNIYSELRRYDEALADHTQAIQLAPTNATFHFNIGAVLANRGQLREALPHFEKAAQLGLSQGAQYAAQVRQMLGIEPTPQVDPAQQAFEAFQRAESAEAMQQAVARFPLLAQADFIAAIEQAIAQQVPPEYRAAFEQRLAWLRQIANEQKRKE